MNKKLASWVVVLSLVCFMFVGCGSEKNDPYLSKIIMYDTEENMTGEVTFDEYGNSIKIVTYNSDGDLASEETREYTYDEQGNMTKQSIEMKMGDVGQTMVMEYDNEYDESSRITKQESYLVDGDTKEYLGMQIYEYSK